MLSGYEDILKAEMILIGVGEEISKQKCEQEELDNAYHVLERLLKGRNYFVLTSNTDGAIHNTKLIPMLIAAPCEENSESQWQSYMNWISCTLGHSLIILELGEGFKNPQIMRWPFEKMTMVHQKSKLIRVNEKFPQIPKELGDRAMSVKRNSINFLKELEQQL